MNCHRSADTRLEGFALEAGVVRVVTSQLFVPSPSTPTNLGLIEKFFGDLEFEPLLMSNWAYSGWYHRAKDVAIFDATEDNLLHFNRGLHPVDVIPLKPNPTQRELILQTLEVPIALR